MSLLFCWDEIKLYNFHTLVETIRSYLAAVHREASWVCRWNWIPCSAVRKHQNDELHALRAPAQAGRCPIPPFFYARYGRGLPIWTQSIFMTRWIRKNEVLLKMASSYSSWCWLLIHFFLLQCSSHDRSSRFKANYSAVRSGPLTGLVEWRSKNVKVSHDSLVRNDNYGGVSDIISVQGKETFSRNITSDLTMKAHQTKMQKYIYNSTK